MESRFNINEAQKDCGDKTQQPIRKTYKKIWYLAFAISAILIIQDIFTNEAFFDKSFQMQRSIQKWNSKTWIFFNEFVSVSCMIFIGIIIAKQFLEYKNRARIVAYVIFSLFVTGLMSLLKILYSQPRPFMVVSWVKAYECSIEFGNPSGHSFLNFTLYGLSLYLYLTERGRTFTNAKKMLLIISYLVWYFMIIYSRVLLGVHSINQVILGLYYGVFFVSLYILYGEKLLIRMVVHMEKKKENHKWKMIAILAIVYFMLQAFIILAYIMSKNHWVSQTQVNRYLDNIYSDCPDLKYSKNILNTKLLYNKCFLDAGVISGSFAFLLFFILQKQNSENSSFRYLDIFHCQEFANNIVKASFFTRAKRIFLILIVPSIVAVIPIIVFSILLKEETVNIYVRYAFSMNLALFLFWWAFVFVSPKLLKKCKINLQGDYVFGFKYTEFSSTTSLDSVEGSTQKIQQYNINNSNRSNNSGGSK